MGRHSAYTDFPVVMYDPMVHSAVLDQLMVMDAAGGAGWLESLRESSPLPSGRRHDLFP